MVSNPTGNGGRSVVNDDEYESVQLIEVPNRTSHNALTQTVLTDCPDYSPHVWKVQWHYINSHSDSGSAQ